MKSRENIYQSIYDDHKALERIKKVEKITKGFVRVALAALVVSVAYWYYNFHEIL